MNNLCYLKNRKVLVILVNLLIFEFYMFPYNNLYISAEQKTDTIPSNVTYVVLGDLILCVCIL